MSEFNDLGDMFSGAPREGTADQKQLAVIAKGFYDAFVTEGFTPDQAMTLVCELLTASM